jgi:hypothetical protein
MRRWPKLLVLLELLVSSRRRRWPMHLVDLELLVSSKRRRQPLLLVALELLVSSRKISTAWSKGLDTSTEIQIDF